MTCAIKFVCTQCRTALVQESSSDPQKFLREGQEQNIVGKIDLYLVNVIKIVCINIC